MRKSFVLFFLVIELLLGFIFYQYHNIEEEHLREDLFLKMKNYSLSFEGDQFDIEITPNSKQKNPYELYQDTQALYILVPFPESTKDLLKIYYPLSKYQQALSAIQWKLASQFLLLSLIAAVISFWFSTYILTPLRDSLKLLEMFIKDMIHDLNTPLSSILINLKMMDGENSEVQSIKQSAKTISMLQHNLDAYLRDSHLNSERFDLAALVQEQVDFFAPLYDYLSWSIEVEPLMLHSDKQAFSRILYNLLSNACKYNITHGTVSIKTQKSTLAITNESYGIEHPDRLFERFYKESERGLGIGLHIVEKLCTELSISKRLHIEDTTVTFLLDLEKLVSK